MTKTTENNHAPKLDRSKMRKFREIARYSLEYCVLESDLAEDRRKIERGEFRAIGREMVFDIVDFLGCDTEDLLTKKCPKSELPEMIYLCDSVFSESSVFLVDNNQRFVAEVEAIEL